MWRNAITSASGVLFVFQGGTEVCGGEIRVGPQVFDDSEFVGYGRLVDVAHLTRS